ncbi:Hypothetical protein, putative [Bodo saltans]|uniref:Uncharacterized protein n=1 Tax=Bodo saltans TaxID=75058 RepID=A0A0S4KP22_BODSA|nr:Hypothetical protein, putative [Bodo saltans]|eukprot:CUI14656.1 Hypothetical protein, putative [Bodo saltans]
MVDPTLVDPSCPLGNCPIVPQPILEAVARIERSEHRDPFGAAEHNNGNSLNDTNNNMFGAAARGNMRGGPSSSRGSGASGGRLKNNPVPLEFPLPTVLVDLASFQHNVRAMARIALASGKKVRIGTKSLRVPALIQLAADVIEAEGLAMFHEHLADRRAAAAGKASAAGAAASLAGFIRVDELDDETADVSQRTAGHAPAIIMTPQQQQSSSVAGLMTYSAAETLFWAKRISSGQTGATFSSLLLAYPIADAYSAHLFVDAMLANAAQRVVCSVVVDAEPQLLMLADAAMRAIQQERYLSVDGFDGAGAVLEIHVVLDIDMSYRPLAESSLFLPDSWLPHLGARRSPLRTAEDVTRVLRLIAATNDRCAATMRHERVGLRFRVDGLMAYEAQVAGVQDLPFENDPSSLWARATVRMMHWFKKLSMGDVMIRRKHCLRAIEKFLENEAAANNASPTTAGSSSEQTLSQAFSPLMSHQQLIVNGGGSGSIQLTAQDPFVTEITIGSGALCGHLFDRFVSSQQHEPLQFLPAIFIAVGVNRVAEQPKSRSKMHQGVVMATQIVACHGGGYIASGAVGGGYGVGDRAPIVVHPPFGMKGFASSEGFGEVQTPFVQECCIVAPGQDTSVQLSNSLRSTTTLNTLGRFHASASVPPTSAAAQQCPGAPQPSPLNMLPLTIGDVVLLRPAKSGEIAEHFDEYLLVDSAASSSTVAGAAPSLVSPLSGSTTSDAPFANSLNIVGGRHVFGTMHRVPTYRGFGSLAS